MRSWCGIRKRRRPPCLIPGLRPIRLWSWWGSTNSTWRTSSSPIPTATMWRRWRRCGGGTRRPGSIPDPPGRPRSSDSSRARSFRWGTCGLRIGKRQVMPRIACTAVSNRGGVLGSRRAATRRAYSSGVVTRRLARRQGRSGFWGTGVSRPSRASRIASSSNGTPSATEWMPKARSKCGSARSTASFDSP